MPVQISLNKFLKSLTAESLQYVSGFINTSHKARFKCPSCDAVFDQLPKEAIKGRCNYCQGEKISKSRVTRDALLLAPKFIFLGEFDGRIPKFKCTKGHLFTQTVQTTKRVGCPACKSPRISPNQYTLTEITELAKACNMTVLSYEKASSSEHRLTYKCDHDHASTIGCVRKSFISKLICRPCNKQETVFRRVQEKVKSFATVLDVRSELGKTVDADLQCISCNQVYKSGSVPSATLHCPKCWVDPLKMPLDVWNTRLKGTGLEVISQDIDGYHVRCLAAGHERVYKYLGNYPICPDCHGSCGIVKYSKPHKQLFSLLVDQGISAEVNVRGLINTNKRIELDVVLQDNKVAIEVDGIYWHNVTKGEDANARLLRRKHVEDAGFRLIRFWDVELQRPNAVLNQINHTFDIFNSKINIKECKTKFIDLAQCNAFLEKWHIQGKTDAIVCLGIFSANKLVAVYAFSYPKKTKAYQWELVRFCVINGYSVDGSFTKLIRSFKKKYQPSSIVSYVDRRFSDGNFLKNEGFTLIRITDPNYFYYRTKTVTRDQIKGKKLAKLLGNTFNQHLSEEENMANAGYGCTFDCGYFIYAWGAIKKVPKEVKHPQIVQKETTPRGMSMVDYLAQIPSTLIVKSDATHIIKKHKLTHECTICGNHWDAAPYVVLKARKGGCPKCANRVTLEDFVKRLSEVNPNLEYINGYTAVTGMVTMKNKQNGKVFTSKAYSVYSGRFPHAAR